MKSALALVVQDLIQAHLLAVHAQIIVPYPVTNNRMHESEKLEQQALHLDTTHKLVHEITAVRKRRVEYEVLIEWTGFKDSCDKTWEPLPSSPDGLPGHLEDTLHNSGKEF